VRAIEIDKQEQELALNYTYLQRQETRSVDSSGRVKSRHSKTTDVTRLEGSPYRRLVAIDDHPLPPADQRKEEEKLRFSIEQRRQEPPEAKEQRLAEWRRAQEKRHAPVKEIPDAFDFRMAPEDVIDGRPVYVIDAVPHPGYKPKQSLTSFLPKVKARFWIEKAGMHWIRIEMETLDTISFGGILVRLGKGGRLVIEQKYINNEVWLPSHALLNASARILLLVGMREEIEFSFTGFKKFQTESRVVPAGQ